MFDLDDAAVMSKLSEPQVSFTAASLAARRSTATAVAARVTSLSSLGEVGETAVETAALDCSVMT